MNFTSYAQSHRGIVRKLNEDACIELPEYNLWVVADGMGGHEAGDVASQMVIDTIKSSMDALGHQQPQCEDVLKAIHKANHLLFSYSRLHLDGKTAGSTVVALFIDQDKYYFMWVGDSRGYLIRQNHLEQKTRDHSQVNDLIDEGVIREDEAENHPLSNVITRAVGVTPEVEISIVEGDLNPNDMFLLCSDGLTGEMSDAEIERVLQPQKIIDGGMALMHSALVRGAKDNVTCIIVKNKGFQNMGVSDMNETTRTPIREFGATQHDVDTTVPILTRDHFN
ncbi:PP2C family protein-serine/threonine phosphatase [Algicola sagamiensis]|uniref:PP2C family protein-serine/threonine phosphatase n=1 Tax=Algicola sagamiensis TaxID=163869 RepID=UPI000379037E|nr:protein phosphatase 2C domain-containing protein [Algicola sagamiensis]